MSFVKFLKDTFNRRSRRVNPMDYDLSFRFGFLAVCTEYSAPAYVRECWRRWDIGTSVVFTHPEVDVTEYSTERGQALIVGDVYVAHGDRGIEDILSRVISQNDFDAFDDLSGRFALFIVSDRGITVLHDPFGSRTIYYATNSDFCLSSHAALCAEASRQRISKRMQAFTALEEYKKKRGTVYLPGDLTMYEGVRCLTPNCLYQRGRGPVRYWPRSDVKPRTQEEFLSICDEYFKKTAAFLQKKYNPVLGLTGGVDTRAVIAGLMAAGTKIDLVTWTGGRLPENEKPVVEEMIQHLQLKHTFLDPGNKDWPPHAARVASAINAATGFCRGGSALTVNMSLVCGVTNVFVRGYGGEIIRGFYNRHRAGSRKGYTPLQVERCAKEFASAYRTKKLTEPDPLFSSVVEEATEGFLSRAAYAGSMHGYDVWDLFYWEQRMGVWGANMLNEMDPAVYSFVGINSRPLYDAAFGLPADYRLGTKLLLDITARYDPPFAQMGIVS